MVVEGTVPSTPTVYEAGHKRVRSFVRRHLSALVAHLTCCLAIGAATSVRWRLAGDSPFPTGIDGGNWLAFGHAIFGEQLRSPTLKYPPVVPLAAVLAEQLFGSYQGIKVLAFVAGIAPALGAYVLFYAWGMRWRGAVLAGMLAASAGTGEAIAWGGYPQLLGLGILPLFILSLDRFLAAKRLSTAVAPAVLLFVSVATSDLVGPFTVIIGALYLVGRYLDLRITGGGNSLRNVALGTGLALVATLPMVQIYSGLIAGVASNEGHKSVHLTPIASGLATFQSVASDLPNFWIIGLAVALLVPLILALKVDHRLAILSLSVLVPCLALVGFENRLAYLMPFGIVAGIGAWWEVVRQRSAVGYRAAATALITFVVIDLLVGTQRYAAQYAFYEVLNPGIGNGLTQLKAITQPSESVAVSPAPHTWELGWWVEGAARRRTVYAGDPMWLNYADEKARNALANQIFSPSNNLEESRRQSREAGISYLFVDKQWAGYESWIRAGGTTNPGEIIYENDSVLIVATGG